MTFWRYLRRSFVFLFGLIWAGIGTAFLITTFAVSHSQEAIDNHPLLIIFAVVGGILASTGWYLLVRAARTASRRATLLKRGTIARAVVTNIEINTRTRINRRYPRYLKYRFTAEGTGYGGRTPMLNPNSARQWNVGDQLRIVYDLRNPSENEADLFRVRRDV